MLMMGTKSDFAKSLSRFDPKTQIGAPPVELCSILKVDATSSLVPKMKRTPTNPHQGSFLFKALSNPREMEHIKERADTIATSCIILRIHNFLSYG